MTATVGVRALAARRFKRRAVPLAVVLLLLALLLPVKNILAQGTQKYVNGLWFNGQYPEGFNTYDSLGEAYLRNNNRDLAIKNYKKSIELNPHNKNAIEALKKLE